MPGHGLAGLREDLAGRHARRRELIADLVVKFQHRQVGLRDEEIFVIAMIADQRKAFRAARQIIARGDGHICRTAR